jgi:CRP-like cAMP-binding protein
MKEGAQVSALRSQSLSRQGRWGRTIAKYRKNQIVFSQADLADSVFYIHEGKVKVTVLSEQGKEAVVAVMGSDEFCGEGCLTGQPRRMAHVLAPGR